MTFQLIQITGNYTIEIMKKNSSIEVKFKIENDMAERILNKILSGRFQWGSFLAQYGRNIESGDIVHFDVTHDDRLNITKSNYQSPIKKKKTHLKTRSGMPACGISKYPSLKISKIIGQIDCSACRKTVVFQESAELKPIRNLLSVLRQV